MKAQTAGQVFKVARIKLPDGGRMLLQVNGKHVAEVDIPADSALFVLRRVKKECEGEKP